jgi:hypothetical protein
MPWHHRAMKLAIAALAAPGLSTPLSAQPPADLHSFLQAHFAEDRQSGAGTRYVAALVDLNGDGPDEAVVRVSGSYSCGRAGCPLFVFTRAASGWRQISRTTITNAPIRALGSRSRGWRDLAVTVAGGGLGRPYEARLSFDGRRYPMNPTVAPARRAPAGAPGRLLIRDGDQGRLLFD